MGNWEREALREALALQKENQRLDAITATAQAAGTAVGGLGLLGAALLAARYFFPDLPNEILSKITGSGGALDVVADIVLPGTPIEFRRRAQDLAKRRGEISRNIDDKCSLASPNYDESACRLAHDEKYALHADEIQLENDIKAADIERGTAFWEFIFSGLGNVEPDAPDTPSNPVVATIKENQERDVGGWLVWLLMGGDGNLY